MLQRLNEPIPEVRRRSWRPRTRTLVVLGSVIVIAMLVLLTRGTGLKSRLVRLVIPGFNVAHTPMRFVSSKPGDADTNFRVDATITLATKLPPGGRLKDATINDRRVTLVRTWDQTVVPATLQVASDRPDRVKVQPERPLEPRTNYSLFVLPGIEDDRGNPVLPYQISFTTAGAIDPDLRFEQVALPTARGAGFTCVSFGPDQKLYAASDDGRIFRFVVGTDGTLGEPQVITSLADANHGKRLITGFCFVPSSTADRLIMYVAHGYYGFQNCPDFTSVLTRLSGADLGVVEDLVVNLPRSTKDHLINQPVFGPDGALYWSQPSNTACGAPDAEWSYRPEHQLSASILRLDLTKLKPGVPLDAKTRDAGGAYDPFAPDAPLTIYAYGVRLAFDLCWHSNGRLYAAVNGSLAAGNTPAGGGVPGISSTAFAEDDWLFRITPGKYYGHPNPATGHYVFNGGNPTANYDFAELFQYPIGTWPDSNWDRPIYDIGQHVSADGTIEYKHATACGGKLRGKLLICRYNWGSDILVLGVDAQGNIATTEFGIPGLSDFAAPLDLTEDRRTGNLYIAEYGAQRITLARPSSLVRQ